MDVAGVLDPEHDRVAVPDRLRPDLRVGVARAVERRGQDPPVLARLGVDDGDLRVAREVESARIPLDREQRPIRRIAARVMVAVAGSQPLRLAALRGHDIDVADQLDVPVLASRRGERDALPVGRPVRARVLVVAVGDLLRLGGAVGGYDVQVTPPVSGPADVVELELKPRESPRRALLFVLLLVRLVRHASRERDPRAVRRPDDLADVLPQVGEALGLATVGGQHVELAVRLLAAPLGDEREPVAVRGPARLRVVLAGREPARRCRTVRARDPDRLAVLVLVPVDRPEDVRDLLAARAQPGIGDPCELVDVLGPHPRHAGTIAR